MFANSSIIAAISVVPSQHSQTAPAIAPSRCSIDEASSNNTASPSNTAISTPSIAAGVSVAEKWAPGTGPDCPAVPTTSTTVGGRIAQELGHRGVIRGGDTRSGEHGPSGPGEDGRVDAG